MIDLRVAEGVGPTGRALRDLLRERNVYREPYTRSIPLPGDRPAEAVVCYGVPYTGPLPCLNGNAGRFDKFRQFVELRSRGVRTVDYYVPSMAEQLPQEDYPLLGRQFSHHGGRDITVAFQPQDIEWRARAGADFFTRYLPNTQELRIWIFRRRLKGAYEKVMVRPEQYRRIGRNYANGFAFQRVASGEVPQGAVDLAASAVQNLDLDFGAVDMVRGMDGQYYVLEVNTAPGVESTIRQGLVGLADSIERWARNGYPRRNGDNG